MAKLAIQFGISDVALKKRCKRLRIPTPGLGYWARVAAGQKPHRARLPPAPSGIPADTVFRGDEQVVPEPVPKSQVPVLMIPEQLASPHAAVVWLQEAMKSGTPDEYDRLRIQSSWWPSTCVRKSTEPRLLILLDALFKGLESRGHTVAAKVPNRFNAHGPELVVNVMEHSFVIHAEERLRPRPHVMTTEEKKQSHVPYYAHQIRKWDQVPEGEIRICIFTGVSPDYRGRTSWSDTKTRTLDSQLGRAILDIENAAKYCCAEQAAKAEREKIRLKEKRERLRESRLNWYVNYLTKDLEEVAARWVTSRQLREFLQAYESKLTEEQRTEVALRWLAAARSHVERIDPLNAIETVAKDLEPADEYLEELISAAKSEAQANSEGPAGTCTKLL